MAGKPRRPGGFNFDLGFSPTQMPEVTPLVNQLTTEMVGLTQPYLAKSIDLAKSAATQATNLSAPIVDRSDNELIRLGLIVSDLQSKIDNRILGTIGEVGIALNSFGVDAYASNDGPAGDGLASVVGASGPVASSPVIHGLGTGFGGPPAPQPGAGFGGPPGPHNWVVVLNCATLQYEAFDQFDPQQNGKELIYIAPTQALALAALGPISAQNPVGVRCNVCAHNANFDPANPLCGQSGGPGPQPSPQPPVPPYTPPTGPVPPYTPPTPPIPQPPTVPCPAPPPLDSCVWIDPTNCKAQVMPCSSGSPGIGWTQQGGPMTAACAAAVAAALNAHLCPTGQPPSGPVPNPQPSIDPVCDPIGYCMYATGGPAGPYSGTGTATHPFSTTFGTSSGSNPVTTGLVGTIAGATMAVLNGIFRLTGHYLDSLIGGWKWPSCRNQIQLASAHVSLAIHDWMTRLVGGSFGRMKRPSQYIANISCPMIFPTETSALSCFLNNTIDESTFRCWVEMNDHCWAPYEKVRDAAASKLSSGELIALRNRDLITPVQYAAGMRERGFLDPALPDKIWEASNAILDPSTISTAVHRTLLTTAEADRMLTDHGYRTQLERDTILDITDKIFDPANLARLLFRGLITDTEYRDEMGRNGWVFDTQKDQLLELMKYAPTYTDITRWMARDVADPAIVTTFGLDDEFDIKFGAQLKQWADNQGITEEIMRNVWRAHWSIPSPGQLYTMFHRLRHLDPADPKYVDSATVETALKQQDILPYWVPKLLEISMAPMTRVDSRRAFALGIVDRQKVLDSFYDRGMSDADAETLTQYVERNILEQVRKGPMPKRVVELKMTPTEFRAELDRLGLNDIQKQELLDYADQQSNANRRYKCTIAVKSRYKTGELTWQESYQRLIGLGHDPTFAADTVNGWQCEIESKGKPQSAAKLCTWLGMGLISAVEMLDRLAKLGYSQADSMKLVIECQQKIVGKATKEYERQLKSQQRETEKQARIAQRDADKLLRQIAQGAKAQQAAVEAGNRRELQLVKSSRAYADRHQSDITDTFVLLKSAMAQTRSNWALSPDQGIKAVVLAVEQSPFVLPADIAARINEIGESMAIAEGV